MADLRKTYKATIEPDLAEDEITCHTCNGTGRITLDNEPIATCKTCGSKDWTVYNNMIACSNCGRGVINENTNGLANFINDQG